jgi:hypothetical protein
MAASGTRTSDNKGSKTEPTGARRRVTSTDPERDHFAEIYETAGYLLGLLFFDPEYGGSAYSSETLANLH